ncbi:hypothetical protein COV18_04990 [Candidatus Woesearchaeota archaeon CG10_big_fil_rev_8_21_14_0_10_37_12]|nr:MAG: hypothetical protein COV18_04990 [Candidatus Woesearchaeota archaeon CG10_big_fil_rev_8_21_14_0_10_37_12]
MVKAVFFDFWGTLVENGTRSPMKQSWQILRTGLPFSPFVQRFEEAVMTKQFPDQAAAFTEACNEFDIAPKPFIIEKLIGVWNKNKLLAKTYDETEVTLRELKQKGLKLVLVSNTLQDNVSPVLEKFGLLELFDHVFLSDEQGVLKTTGLFEKALKEAKLKAKDVISVGDSIETDIKGAEAAGIKSYLIDRRNTREFESKIVSLDELTDIVEE